MGAILLAATSAVWVSRADLEDSLRLGLFARSEYERYAATIRRRGLDETSPGRAWLEHGAAAVAAAARMRSPFTESGSLGGGSAAAAWRFPVRRGQRISVEAAFVSGLLFIDLLECAKGCRPVAGATGGSLALVHEVRKDGELVLRVQPELLHGGPYVVSQRAEATLAFPVAGVSARAIQSAFGAGRDGGSRSHEGIDIFAPRGTPVIAASDGLITGSTTNRLGGKVVWLWSMSRGMAMYYAHLDRQAVEPGDRVAAGDVLGWVGNTGNARGTAPHLHFGIYARPGGAVDPLPYVCDAPCPSPRGSGRL